MPNSNPQAVRVANERIRRLAHTYARLYSDLKAAQIDFAAEGWGALFPNEAEIIVDGSSADGRTPITNADVRSFMLTAVVGILTLLEANANANAIRDRVFKIAPADLG